MEGFLRAWTNIARNKNSLCALSTAWLFNWMLSNNRAARSGVLSPIPAAHVPESAVFPHILLRATAPVLHHGAELLEIDDQRYESHIHVNSSFLVVTMRPLGMGWRKRCCVLVRTRYSQRLPPERAPVAPTHAWNP